MDCVQLGTERDRSCFGDFVAGLDANSVMDRMSEEADVNANRHSRNQHVLAVGTEEGRLSLIQANRVDKRTDQVLGEPKFVEILSGGRVDFLT